MNAGLPLIVSDQTAVHREIAEARAGLTVPCETEALASALMYMLSDAEKRRAMGRNGRELARQRFSVKAVVRQTIEAYEQVVSQCR